MLVEEIFKWLQYAEIFAPSVLIWRLIRQKLYRAYHWFFIYLIFDLVQSLADLIHLSDPASVRRYIAGQTIKAALTWFVVREIYELALAERQALARFGRKLLGYGLAGAALLSLAIFPFAAKMKAIKFPLLRYTLLTEATTDSTFLLFLGAIALFLLWFPVEIRKNLAVYISGFAVYFVSRWVTVMIFLAKTSVQEKVIFNDISLIVKLVCIGFWTIAMREAGEREKTTTGLHWNPKEMDRLKKQLDEINDSLERLSR